MQKNEGIIQHGGSLTAHNLAVGQNAVASESAAPDLADLRRRVDELLSEIRRHASELPQSTEVISTAETLPKVMFILIFLCRFRFAGTPAPEARKTAISETGHRRPK